VNDLNDNIAGTDSKNYRQQTAVMGDTVELGCNTTQSSGVVWKWNTTHGHFSYVSYNGSISGNLNVMIEFSVVNTSERQYSLIIDNVLHADSGFYDCYETNGKRIVGYQLVATSKFLNRPMFDIKIPNRRLILIY